MTTQSAQTREIKNLGVLDLTGMKSPDELNNISAIKNVGVVVVPQSLASKLASIPMVNVGNSVAVPDGKKVKVNAVMGPMQTSGEGLAPQESDGDGENILVVMGPLTITTPVEKIGYTQLIVMGPIFAPKGSEAALGSTMVRVIGPIQYYPAGAGVKIQTGQVKLSGAILANPAGDANDVLVVFGQVFITSPIEKVGYKHVIVGGQMFAPKQSEDVLGPYLEVNGQVLWYSGTPRIFNGDDRLSAAYFDLLKEPITMLINGHVAVESDVTLELFRQKVTEIILNGTLEGPKHLVPLFQALATEHNGVIQVEGANAVAADTDDD
jgi:hypothetical protein